MPRNARASKDSESADAEFAGADEARDSHSPGAGTHQLDSAAIMGGLEAPSGLAGPLQGLQEALEETNEDKLVEAMQGLTADSIDWGHPSFAKGMKRMEAQKPFYAWLFLESAEPTKMNCWESVLFAASRARLCTKKDIKNLIMVQGSRIALVENIVSSPAGTANGGEKRLYEIPSTTIIPKGHVIVFGKEGQHVGLSNGTVDGNGEHGVLELDSDTGGVSANTVEGVARRKTAYGQNLYWGPLPLS